MRTYRPMQPRIRSRAGLARWIARWLVRPSGGVRRAAARCRLSPALLTQLVHGRRTRLAVTTAQRLLGGVRRLLTAREADRAARELQAVLDLPPPRSRDRRRPAAGAVIAFAARRSDQQLGAAERYRKAKREAPQLPPGVWVEVSTRELARLRAAHPGRILWTTGPPAAAVAGAVPSAARRRTPDAAARARVEQGLASGTMRFQWLPGRRARTFDTFYALYLP